MDMSVLAGQIRGQVSFMSVHGDLSNISCRISAEMIGEDQIIDAQIIVKGSHAGQMTKVTWQIGLDLLPQQPSLPSSWKIVLFLI